MINFVVVEKEDGLSEQRGSSRTEPKPGSWKKKMAWLYQQTSTERDSLQLCMHQPLSVSIYAGNTIFYNYLAQFSK